MLEKSTAHKERGKEWVSGSSITQDRPLSDQKAAEKGIGLEERRAVNREDINISGFGYVLGQAACILGANGWVRIAK